MTLGRSSEIKFFFFSNIFMCSRALKLLVKFMTAMGKTLNVLAAGELAHSVLGPQPTVLPGLVPIKDTSRR